MPQKWSANTWNNIALEWLVNSKIVRSHRYSSSAKSIQQQSPKWSNKKLFSFSSSDEFCQLQLVSGKRMPGRQCHACHMQESRNARNEEDKSFLSICLQTTHILQSTFVMPMCTQHILYYYPHKKPESANSEVMNTSWLNYMVFNKRFSIASSSWISCARS